MLFALSAFRPRPRRLNAMARNPFTYDRDAGHDESSEFGFGRGKYPDPRIDFSDGGVKSGIPLADPDRHSQQRLLQEIRRMDINDPSAQPSPYVAGNTDRYGAQPPLVRETKVPRREPRPRYARNRMERHW